MPLQGCGTGSSVFLQTAKKSVKERGEGKGERKEGKKDIYGGAQYCKSLRTIE